MLSRARLLLGVIAVTTAMSRADQTSAQSLGCLALPSTMPQVIGYGYGAGHHAPIVRTPAQRPPRMDRHVKAPACYGPLCPEPYAPIGCYGAACCAPGTVPISRSPRSEMGTVPVPGIEMGTVPLAASPPVRPLTAQDPMMPNPMMPNPMTPSPEAQVPNAPTPLPPPTTIQRPPLFEAAPAGPAPSARLLAVRPVRP